LSGRSGKGGAKGKGLPVREKITPVPEQINGEAYYKVGRYDFTVGQAGGNTNRAKLRDRVFHAYLELFFQAKHDDKIAAYCKDKHIDCKKEKGTKVVRSKGDDTTFGIYEDLGRVACEVVCDHMAGAWAANKGGPAFAHQTQNHLGVQGVEQDNGYHYDLSFIYCGKDVFVHFHCYPPRG
jgi:hypothetical protein